MHPHVKLTMQRLLRESHLCRPVILSGTGGAFPSEQHSSGSRFLPVDDKLRDGIREFEATLRATGLV